MPEFLYIAVPEFQHIGVPNQLHIAVPEFQHIGVPNQLHIAVPEFQHIGVPNHLARQFALQVSAGGVSVPGDFEIVRL